MLDLEERNRARKKAMRLLEHMDRTEKGLTDKLRQAEFSPEAVEDAIAYVKSYGYINDARYARTYISFRMETRSRQKILSELQLKGVDRQTALDAWNEMEELMEPDEREVLRRTIERNMRRTQSLMKDRCEGCMDIWPDERSGMRIFPIPWKK